MDIFTSVSIVTPAITETKSFEASIIDLQNKTRLVITSFIEDYQNDRTKMIESDQVTWPDKCRKYQLGRKLARTVNPNCLCLIEIKE